MLRSAPPHHKLSRRQTASGSSGADKRCPRHFAIDTLLDTVNNHRDVTLVPAPSMDRGNSLLLHCVALFSNATSEITKQFVQVISALPSTNCDQPSRWRKSGWSLLCKAAESK